MSDETTIGGDAWLGWMLGWPSGTELLEEEIAAALAEADARDRARARRIQRIEDGLGVPRTYMADPPAYHGVETPDVAPGDLPRMFPADVPVDLPASAHRDLSAQRRELLTEIIEQMIKGGASHVQHCLLRAGYTRDEAILWIRHAQDSIRDAGVLAEMDAVRAMAIARYEAMLHVAMEAGDVRAGVMCQREIDRITGIREDTELTSLEEFVELASEITSGKLRVSEEDSAAVKAIDVEILTPREGVDWDRPII